MRVSIKDQCFGSHRSGQIDRMLPEEFPDALANESWFDKEMVEFDLRLTRHSEVRDTCNGALNLGAIDGMVLNGFGRQAQKRTVCLYLMFR